MVGDNMVFVPSLGLKKKKHLNLGVYVLWSYETSAIN